MRSLEKILPPNETGDPDITARQFGEYRRRIESGDPIAIFEATVMCSGKKVEIPQWLADELMKTIADFHLGNKPSWKKAGNQPLIIVRRRIEQDVRRRAVKAVRLWIKDRRQYHDLPTRCIKAWFGQRIHHSEFNNYEDALRLTRFGIRGLRIAKDGPLLKCSPRTLRRAAAEKKHIDMPPIPGRIASVFGLCDPDAFFGTDQPMPNNLK
ncbi:hypothetical protein [Roseovarius sp. Pro17]|uniref:hypothetical protein n=1 Tax=Roseovarius sp. Pro17 TaxID=3108175 RepID=UPI002D7746D4|nr:hypothetical protein [Roseovarius sp. Pro17]